MSTASTSQLVWSSNTGDDFVGGEWSAFDHLTLDELITLHARTVEKWADPAYELCDNRSDALCCNDCGVSEMVAEIAFRSSLPFDLYPVETDNYPTRLPENDGGPYRIGA